MENVQDLSFLDFKDHFEVVDPNTLELLAEDLLPVVPHPKPKPIVASMQRHGLLEVPLVAGKKVIDGARRVRAAIELGKQFILIRQVGTLVKPEAILAHSYLVRRTVTVLREAEHLAGLKLEYESDHPESTKGGNQKTKKAKKEQNEISSFCQYVAGLTDRDPRSIQRLVKIASLDVDVRAAIHLDEEFANREDKLYSLLGCGKGDAANVTQLEVFNVWQAKGKQTTHDKTGDTNGKYTFFDCVNEVAKQKKLQDKELDAVANIGANYKIMPGDFRDLMKEIPDGSIDAVISDPPYLKEYHYLLPAFVKETARVLKPNGFAAIMYGNIYMNIAMKELEKHLHYRCIFADDYGNVGQSLFGVGISNHWKAILIYGKKTHKLPVFGADIIRRPVDPVTGKPKKNGKEKSWFHWQQPLHVFEELVKRFVPSGGTVLDPFLGSGTTMIAALKHGRNCIGMELLSERIRYVKYRLLKELGLGEDKAA
jgi:SAM-dependent methyltransferase